MKSKPDSWFLVGLSEVLWRVVDFLELPEMSSSSPKPFPICTIPKEMKQKKKLLYPRTLVLTGRNDHIAPTIDQGGDQWF